MEEAAKAKEANKIQTFVFLDLESTGLKTDNPRIVELSLIAVSRDHLLEMKDSATLRSTSTDADEDLWSSQASAHSINSTNSDSQRKTAIPKLPRVIHKYTRLYYPRKLLTQRVEAINGLNNHLLEHLPCFTEASAKALILFLDLPGPVSLVAHNGNRYDYPLLMAELNSVGCVDKFLDLQCIDSLSAIKDIDALLEREDIREITKLAEFFSDDDLDDFFLEEQFNPSKRRRSPECDKEKGSKVIYSQSQSYESTSHMGRANHHTMEVSAAPLMTPMKNHIPGQTHIPATPSKAPHPPPHHHTPQGSKPGTPGTSGFCAKVTKESSKVRRTLTYENGKRKFVPKMSYSQVEIYKRLFNSYYAAHRAEADCEALLTICGHYGNKFVEWADSFATSFSSSQPMWVKRKSFNLSQEG